MQKAAPPAIMELPNVVLLAPTGSGKTVAFLLPILAQLNPETPGVQCLIVSPTRELAIRLSGFGRMNRFQSQHLLCGGHSMQIETNNLSQAPALLIGTPGRILEHITRKTFELKSVKTLILDEFDKSLALGFHEQMSEIIKNLRFLKNAYWFLLPAKRIFPLLRASPTPKC